MSDQAVHANVGSHRLGQGMAFRARRQSVVRVGHIHERFVGAIGRASVGFGLAVGRSRSIRPIVRGADLNSIALRPPSQFWRRPDAETDQIESVSTVLSADSNVSVPSIRERIDATQRSDDARARRVNTARSRPASTQRRPTWTDQILDRSAVGFVEPPPAMGPPPGHESSGDRKLDQMMLALANSGRLGNKESSEPDQTTPLSSSRRSDRRPTSTGSPVTDPDARDLRIERSSERGDTIAGSGTGPGRLAKSAVPEAASRGTNASISDPTLLPSTGNAATAFGAPRQGQRTTPMRVPRRDPVDRVTEMRAALIAAGKIPADSGEGNDRTDEPGPAADRGSTVRPPAHNAPPKPPPSSDVSTNRSGRPTRPRRSPDRSNDSASDRPARPRGASEPSVLDRQQSSAQRRPPGSQGGEPTAQAAEYVGTPFGHRLDDTATGDVSNRSTPDISRHPATDSDPPSPGGARLAERVSGTRALTPANRHVLTLDSRLHSGQSDNAQHDAVPLRSAFAATVEMPRGLTSLGAGPDTMRRVTLPRAMSVVHRPTWPDTATEVPPPSIDRSDIATAASDDRSIGTEQVPSRPIEPPFTALISDSPALEPVVRPSLETSVAQRRDDVRSAPSLLGHALRQTTRSARSVQRSALRTTSFVETRREYPDVEASGAVPKPRSPFAVSSTAPSLRPDALTTAIHRLQTVRQQPTTGTGVDTPHPRLHTSVAGTPRATTSDAPLNDGVLRDVKARPSPGDEPLNTDSGRRSDRGSAPVRPRAQHARDRASRRGQWPDRSVATDAAFESEQHSIDAQPTEASFASSDRSRKVSADDLSERFMEVLSERVQSRATPLPAVYRPMADVITGGRRVLLSTDNTSRRALRSVGKVAATTGEVIHVDRDVRPDARMNEVIAHELTHVAHHSPTPRFFDGVDNPEERRADEVARLIARSPIAPRTTAAANVRESAVRRVARDAGATIRRTPAARPTAPPGSIRGSASASLHRRPSNAEPTVIAADLAGSINSSSSREFQRMSSDDTTVQRLGNGVRHAAPVLGDGASMLGQGQDPAIDDLLKQFRASGDVSRWFGEELEQHLEQLMRRLEDRIVEDFERRGGRSWGAL